MSRTSVTIRSGLLVLLLLLVALSVAGCDSAGQSNNGDKLTPTPAPPVATPTVDMAHARAAFQSGGELSYKEVVALRLNIVGGPEKINSAENYYEEQDKFLQREDDFAAQLEKCKLKDSIGWVAWSMHEYDENGTYIPDRNILAVYLSNPFDGSGKDLRGDPEMYLTYFTDQEVEQFKYGQRIGFRGDLLLVHRNEAIKNPEYRLLADYPPVPTPTADELKDLTVVLDRTGCYGTCPDYTLTVGADGKVTFEGHYYTKVKGAATGTIDSTKMVDLATAIKKADFLSLDDRYSADVTDCPTYTLTVQMGGQTKRVESYATRPRRLGLLMDRIDQIANSEQWVDDETGR